MLNAVQPPLVLKNESGKEKIITNMCFSMSSRNKLYVSACGKKEKNIYMITKHGNLLVVQLSNK